jgi:hypothetical protein
MAGRMLHIASAHSGSPRWLEIQRRQLAEHIPVPYVTWGSVAGIDSSHAAGFDHVIEQKGPEAGKLNHLAVEICEVAGEEDLLMFLAPDAFPVADPMAVIEEALAGAALLAVRRSENDGDPQPHPCFCVTTVGAWQRLGGDWSDGYPWTAEGLGRVTDFGGNLLRRLELSGTPWVSIERTSSSGLDPLHFGVYGGIVYFHNANEIGRVHRLRAPGRLPGAGAPILGRALAPLERQRRLAWERGLLRRSARDSQEIFGGISAGTTDWLRRIGHDPSVNPSAG